MNVSEIYTQLGQFVVDIIPEDNWTEAFLNIKLVPKNIGMTGKYKSQEGKEVSLRTRFSEELGNSLFELHRITTEGGHNRWNRALFKLWPGGKFDMEFTWDQELHDEIERLNKK